jgi:hypothetical protein
MLRIHNGVTALVAFLAALPESASNAAGFHWRFSTVVGCDMGWQIGASTVQNCMQPLVVGTR